MRLMFILVILFLSFETYAKHKRKREKVRVESEGSRRQRSLFSPVTAYIEGEIVSIYFNENITNATVNVYSAKSQVRLNSINTNGQGMIDVQLPEIDGVYRLEIIIGGDVYVGVINKSGSLK